MEEAWQILNYLPRSFKTEKEQEYINFLWESFTSNYDNEKYQFAFLAFHMLFMSFVYFIVWQIKHNQPQDFNKAVIGFSKDVEKGLLGASSPFTFSEVNESAIFRFLKLIGCDNNKIGNYTKLVKDRNDIAHSNGNIFYSATETIDEKITQTLKLIEEIQQQSKPVIESCYQTFLKENHDPEAWEYSESNDQIREILIHKNYLSQKDIEICLNYTITNLETADNYENIKELHQELTQEYKDSAE